MTTGNIKQGQTSKSLCRTNSEQIVSTEIFPKQSLALQVCNALPTWACGEMGCTPTKPATFPNERYVNSLVYHIHSSAPPKTPNQTKIIQEDIVDHLEEPNNAHTDYDPKIWLQRALQNMNIIREKGHWIAGVTGGGCRNNVEMFSLNPQYQLTVISKGSSEVLIGLFQMEPRNLPIGFHVYKTEVKNHRLTAEYLLCVQPEFSTGAYRVRDELWHLHSLVQGHYTLIVSTYRPSTAKYELVVHSCAQIELTKLVTVDYVIS